jgi:TonB family protein
VNARSLTRNTCRTEPAGILSAVVPGLLRGYALPAALAILVHAGCLGIFWGLSTTTGFGHDGSTSTPGRIDVPMLITVSEVENDANEETGESVQERITASHNDGGSDDVRPRTHDERGTTMSTGLDQGGALSEERTTDSLQRIDREAHDNGHGISTALYTGSRRFVPRPIGEIRAIYPRRAREAGLEGEVVIEVTVDRSGKAAGTNVVRSSGHPLLDDAAIHAVNESAYRPAIDNGEPIEGNLVVSIAFVLEK